jgi:hypothetical protein
MIRHINADDVSLDIHAYDTNSHEYISTCPGIRHLCTHYWPQTRCIAKRILNGILCRYDPVTNQEFDFLLQVTVFVWDQIYQHQEWLWIDPWNLSIRRYLIPRCVPDGGHSSTSNDHNCFHGNATCMTRRTLDCFRKYGGIFVIGSRLQTPFHRRTPSYHGNANR